MDELDGGIRRVTLPLPTRPGHVHAYLLPGDDGWIVVDTGVGHAGREGAPGAPSSSEAGGPVAAIFVTHFHPDHVGAAADLHELTGAPVYQGTLDYAQCELVWGNPNWSERLLDWFQLHGVARRRDRRARRPELALPAVHPLPARSRAHARRASTWTAGSSSPRRGTPTASSASLKDGVLIAADHLLDRGSRRPSGSGRRAVPTRSATTSRALDRDDRARRRASRCPGTAIRSRIPPAARASSRSTTACGSRRPSRRSARSRRPATSSRSRSSETTSSRRAGASRSPRRCRTPSGS